MKYAILDTNMHLHWEIQNVDWCKELETDSVTILVPPTVLKELDEKKQDYNRTIGERATKRLQTIESLDASGGELRPGVKIMALDREPSIDWPKHGLDPNVMDDRIIATIIERSNGDDVFVTDDSTPRIKARKRGIAVVEVKAPRLAPAKSETEKELEKLKQELISHKDRTPKLSLSMTSPKFENNMPVFPIKTGTVLSASEIQNMVDKRRSELEIDFSVPPYTNMMFAYDIEGYKVDVESHLQLYKSYLEEKNVYDQRMSGILKTRFVLSCEGKVPAQGVYCKIKLPAGFKTLKEESLPQAPAEPEKPVPLLSAERMMRSLTPQGIGSVFHAMDSLAVRPVPRRVRMRTHDVSIEVEADEIKHGFEVKTDMIYISLPSPDSAKNFQLQYEIHADNLPVPVDNEVNVAVERN